MTFDTYAGSDRWVGDPGRNLHPASIEQMSYSQEVDRPYWPVEAFPRLPVDGFRIGGEVLTAAAGGWWIEGMLLLVKAVDEAEEPREPRRASPIEAASRRSASLSRRIEALEERLDELRTRRDDEVADLERRRDELLRDRGREIRDSNGSAAPRKRARRGLP